MDAYDNYIDLLLEKGLSAKSEPIAPPSPPVSKWSVHHKCDNRMEYFEKMGDAYDEVNK